MHESTVRAATGGGEPRTDELYRVLVRADDVQGEGPIEEEREVDLGRERRPLQREGRAAAGTTIEATLADGEGGIGAKDGVQRLEAHTKVRIRLGEEPRVKPGTEVHPRIGPEGQPILGEALQGRPTDDPPGDTVDAGAVPQVAVHVDQRGRADQGSIDGSCISNHDRATASRCAASQGIRTKAWTAPRPARAGRRWPGPAAMGPLLR